MTSAKPLRFSTPLSPHERWADMEPMVRAAQRAEALGYFGVTLPEHIVMPVKLGVEPMNVVWFDNFVLGSHIASLTQRIRLIFCVMVVPYRPAVQTAKQIATLDQVSKGRLIVGVGAGWMRAEFRNLGLPFDERGAMTDEYLAAMRALWTQESPSFQGKHVSFTSLIFQPKCYQKPHAPLWIGGSGPRILRRVVEHGQGWMPMVGTIDDMARDIREVKQRTKAAGRDPDALDFSFSIVVGERDEYSEKARAHVVKERNVIRPQAVTVPEIVDLLGEYRAAGFTHLGVSWKWRTIPEYMEGLEWFAREIMPRVSSS
ncbi:MAG: LLM class F420-dependent oxidoreductase [Chloroflexi bacterium]|nr:LLM class F420-dependent oxidoreductase [Chloroflexota bacterium]